MNERYALRAELAELTGQFRLDRIEFPYYEREQYEPTGTIPVIRPAGGERLLSGQRWGLMPYWGKSSLHANRDTLGDKPYMMYMLARKRCVIPCSGILFDRQEGRERHTYRRVHAEKPVFGAAGLYDVWLDSEKNEYPMCTIITTGNPYDGTGSKPLVLEGEALELWLDAGLTGTDRLKALLRTVPEAAFSTELVASG